ncbi:3-hydroxyacyl-CoA dehydrogenase NAD-binding domain-containing protein [Microbaculum marinisediminis]|uniref:3-hydroxyacyl-CoA dehydrogenase NAD-binding domain-containing protein n=1 Tax=Microbaculum marinisediminis TaxID=2931392 RepID=A0AAW5QZV2_9HYPH|nr:3-hydroxyacyl-CoA dehydrogenase NAD-binding domain-containing protein [Microbaculum sp. A6E488]MCT8971869.1 3-hydroxyacyl-CoA dehydrogenase NAD-binding domain-containing protein [Microbaculum sp. A6E488]
MSDVVSVTRDGDVAVVTIDNPPVNALSHAVRKGVFDAMAALREDSEVKAIVLACAGRTFSAGADITEFGKPPQPPALIEMINAIEAMPKPVVAALHGTVLGGGFEVALGCHHRIAAPGTRVGLPEVKLGILPGAGGTQRLPRLIGAIEALKIIVSGDPVPAEEALKFGAIDEIATGDLTQAAVALAKKVGAEGKEPARVSDRDDKLADVKADPTAFNEAAGKLTARARGLEAPHACVEAVKWSFELPIEEGLKREREAFMKLVAGDQSKAQRHLFFAERQAAKVLDMPKGTKPRAVDKVAVIGAGTMGGGISMNFANAGIPVTIVETSQEALDRGFGTIEKNYNISVSRGRMTEADVRQRMSLLTGSTDMNDVADADLIIEAVFEEMDIKKQIFSKLDEIAKPTAVLATNTSYLDVNAIANMTKRPSSVLGTHFFSPANVMKLLEIVRGAETAPDVLATVIDVGRKIKKVPVVVGVCFGFVGNRMLRARSLETERLLLEGATPQQVDKAITGFGFPMGPFAMGDLAGLDIGWRIRKQMGATADGGRADIADALCEMGRFGQKTGRGFYIYEKGARAGIPDPEVEALIVETAAKQGIERREIGDEEIVERLIYPMISEGAKILEEGVAQRPGDIDVVWVNGYGFPVWRGGPMFYADQVGLKHVRNRLAHYAEVSGNAALKPAPLLDRLADEGSTFAAYGREKERTA